MGVGASLPSASILEALTKEFNRVKADEVRNYITLTEIVELNFMGHLPVDFKDLGVLYCLDNDHDGKVTYVELARFVTMCLVDSAGYEAHEAQRGLSALCAQRMWLGSISKNSPCHPEVDFTSWLMALLACCDDWTKTSLHEDGSEVDVEPSCALATIKHLFKLLNVEETNELDFQSFVDLLQRSAEEDGLLDLGNTKLDHLVPLETVERFVSSWRERLGDFMLSMHGGPNLRAVAPDKSDGSVYIPTDCRGLQLPLGPVPSLQNHLAPMADPGMDRVITLRGGKRRGEEQVHQAHSRNEHARLSFSAPQKQWRWWQR